MSQQLDLSGRWIFKESFDYGTDTGFAEIEHDGNQVVGTIHVAEQIEGEETFIVRQDIKGHIHGRTIRLEGTAYEIPFYTEEIEYQLDSWQGTILSEDKIVGKSEDEEGTIGSFQMTREPIDVSDSDLNKYLGLN